MANEACLTISCCRTVKSSGFASTFTSRRAGRYVVNFGHTKEIGLHG